MGCSPSKAKVAGDEAEARRKPEATPGLPPAAVDAAPRASVADTAAQQPKAPTDGRTDGYMSAAAANPAPAATSAIAAPQDPVVVAEAVAADPTGGLGANPGEDGPADAEEAVKRQNLAVMIGGHAQLQSSVGKTSFKGLAEFEDRERQEANHSIMNCFGCYPGAPNNEHRFDSITNLLAGIFSMPVALVVFLDSALAYIKAEHGMSQAEPTSRGLSFCTWTLVTLKPEVQVISDCDRDGRFKTHPYVEGLPNIRFYAGAPLISSHGHRLGSLCLVDYTPRNFDAECCNILCNFAEIVVRDAERYALEDGVAAAQISSSPSAGGPPLRELAAGEANTSVALVAAKQLGWPLLFISDGFASATGISEQQDAGKPFWDLFWQPGGLEGSAASGGDAFAEKVAHGASFIVEVAGTAIASDSVCLVRFKPAALEALDAQTVHVNISIPGPIRKALDQNPSAYYFATVQNVSRSAVNSAGSVAMHTPQQEVPFDDLQLGGLLGKGSFGSVYIGLLAGSTPVAVKVIEHKASKSGHEAREAKEELEATLGMQLEHPNIVRTLKFTSRQQAHVESAFRQKARLVSPRASSLATGGASSTGPQSATADSASGYTSAPATGDNRLDGGTGAGDVVNGSRNVGTGGNVGGTGGGGGSSLRSSSRGKPRRMETWIVLELCDQGSLQAAIDEGCFRDSGSVFDGVPNMLRILSTAKEIASAMEYLHNKGSLHGDLTANNILLASKGGAGVDPSLIVDPESYAANASPGDLGMPASCEFVAKVSDFGLSRAAATETAMSTNTFGTVTHMPPELLRDGQLSRACDCYSFGVLLWEMYVGERPWAGMRPVTIILKKTQDKARLNWPPGTPEPYRALADACMATDPKARPSFSAILSRIAELQAAGERGELTPDAEFAVYHKWAGPGGTHGGGSAPNSADTS